MLALMFSTAGVPPFVGFWAKLRVLQELWSSHHPALVVIAAGVSVIGVFYTCASSSSCISMPRPRSAPDQRSPRVRFALGINAAAVSSCSVSCRHRCSIFARS